MEWLNDPLARLRREHDTAQQREIQAREVREAAEQAHQAASERVRSLEILIETISEFITTGNIRGYPL